MNARIRTNESISTLKLEIDFNQLLSNNFKEICKAIAIRGRVLKELVTITESNNRLAETVIQFIKRYSGEEETRNNLCKELHVCNATAQYLMDMSLDVLFSLDSKSAKQKYEEYKKAIDSFLVHPPRKND